MRVIHCRGDAVNDIHALPSRIEKEERKIATARFK